MDKLFTMKVSEELYLKLRANAFRTESSMGKFVREAIIERIRRLQEDEITQ